MFRKGVGMLAGSLLLASRGPAAPHPHPLSRSGRVVVAGRLRPARIEQPDYESRALPDARSMSNPTACPDDTVKLNLSMSSPGAEVGTSLLRWPQEKKKGLALSQVLSWQLVAGVRYEAEKKIPWMAVAFTYLANGLEIVQRESILLAA